MLCCGGLDMLSPCLLYLKEVYQAEPIIYFPDILNGGTC